jgi:heme/copper-type cytochrome/quinol oxidase subunit 1
MTTIETSPEVAAATSSDADSGRFLASVADWLTSTDHKRIGRLYLAGGLLGLLDAVAISALLAVELLDNEGFVLDSGALPQLLDAQRIALIFGSLLPLAVAMCVAFVPLQLGAKAIAFPRLATTGFWMWFGGLILAGVALINDGGTLGFDSDMVDLFIVSLGLMAIGVTATAGSVATSILTTRAPGMTMRRVPPFTWSALVFSIGIFLVMPVFVGTLVYLFLDHRNARTGFGGNTGIFDWAGWLVTQPASFLFAIPAIGVLVEILPITFKKRMPARGLLFTGIALIGVAAFGAVTQQNLQNLPWSGSQLSGDDIEQKVRDLVPYSTFNLLPVLGMLVVMVIGLVIARPRRGMRVNVTAGFVLSFFGFGMIFVGMLGTVFYAIDDLGLQGTVFEGATLISIVYGAALAVMGAVAHWAPKLWGRTINATALLVLALLGMTGAVLAVFPHYISGFLGQEAGPIYSDGDLLAWNILVLVGHSLFLLTVVVFIVLTIMSTMGHDDDLGDDPWDAQTLEWMTTSPAPKDNYAELFVVHSPEPLLDLKESTTTADRSQA